MDDSVPTSLNAFSIQLIIRSVLFLRGLAEVSLLSLGVGAAGRENARLLKEHLENCRKGLCDLLKWGQGQQYDTFSQIQQEEIRIEEETEHIKQLNTGIKQQLDELKKLQDEKAEKTKGIENAKESSKKLARNRKDVLIERGGTMGVLWGVAMVASLPIPPLTVVLAALGAATAGGVAAMSALDKKEVREELRKAVQPIQESIDSVSGEIRQLEEEVETRNSELRQRRKHKAGLKSNLERLRSLVNKIIRVCELLEQLRGLLGQLIPHAQLTESSLSSAANTTTTLPSRGPIAREFQNAKNMFLSKLEEVQYLLENMSNGNR